MEKKSKEVKNSTCSENFYLSIIDALKSTTNLTKIKEKFNIEKQELNYYLRELVKRGIINHKGRGWYEVVKEVKNSTKYGSLLVKDSSRGHAYIWNAKIEKIPERWEKRIEILENKGINYKLVGAKMNTPRIMIQGRKVWLCNNNLRIFDKKNASYYGDTAKKSRQLALQQVKLIIGTLNNKLGTNIKPSDIYFKKEHYALIKNDLAIEENKKGNIIHISDEEGEWLLIDDSLGLGGELENIGKKSFPTNIKMQEWWNENKKDNFETTKPSRIKKEIEEINSNLDEFKGMIKKLSTQDIQLSQVIEQISNNQIKLTTEVAKLKYNKDR